MPHQLAGHIKYIQAPRATVRDPQAQDRGRTEPIGAERFEHAARGRGRIPTGMDRGLLPGTDNDSGV